TYHITMASTQPNTRAFLNKHLSENYPNKKLPSLTEAQVNEIVKSIESALNEKQKNKQAVDNSFWTNLLNKGKPPATNQAQNKGKPVGNHKGASDTETESESESENESDTDDETPKKTASHTHKPVINSNTDKFTIKGPVAPPQKVPAKNNKIQDSDTETESDTDDETPKKTAHPVASNTKKPVITPSQVPAFNIKGPPVVAPQNVPAKNNNVPICDTDTDSDSD
ncbi:hypothetical protein ABTP16_14470, partial [Acinetobacter baumannii]